MILSKIYCNDEKSFKPVKFDKGMNFILSEDHSVGKSTLFKLIDYCLFKSKSGFLKLKVFENLEFYLEVKVRGDLYVTVKRCIAGKGNDCVKVSSEEMHCHTLEETEFDFKGGETKAQQFFEDVTKFKLPGLRSYITFFLRDQDNQSDVFRLNKFVRSKDIDYKPVVANLLGVDGKLIRNKYELEEEISTDSMRIKGFEQDLGSYSTKEAVLEELEVYESQLGSKEQVYEDFDFYLSEHNISQELVDKVEAKVSKLNSQRNSLKREIDYIDNALATQMSISIEDINGLFEEMQVLFPDNLKNNYEKVVAFNQQITKERELIFKDNKVEFQRKLGAVDSELKELNSQRQGMLGILKETDTMSKFKKLEQEIIELKASMKAHQCKLEIFESIDQLKEKIQRNQTSVENLIKKQEFLVKSEFLDKLKTSAKMFGKIVFNRDLAFSVGFNTNNNLEFHLKLAGSSGRGFDNYEDEGNTVKKLLCFIFSASLAYTHNDDHFFQFVAFDSPFDGDKNVWQNGVYEALKKLSESGIQSLITSIADEIKNPDNLREIKEKYVCRTLTEEDKLLGDF